MSDSRPTAATGPAATARLVASLRDAERYDHPVGRIETIETHISHVLLAGDYAYKIKKPVALGFLDFSTLAKRKFYCEEELRLNRRLAPALYLSVVPITGSACAPRLGGTGPAIEYAVKMRRFASQSRLDHVLAREGLRTEHVRSLAATVAAFHREVATADPSGPFADETSLRREMLENFDVLERLRPEELEGDALDDLRAWSERNLAANRRAFQDRRRRGAIRECHGDMHLANMVLIDGEPIIFDGIEFNERFRWIDVMSEVAFVVMDLDYRGRTDLARSFLSEYLEHTGDYDGLPVLIHYLVYRALVRAKVAAIRLDQSTSPSDEGNAARASVMKHVGLALRYRCEHRPSALILTHGVSGSGKSWLSERLVPLTGALRVRSDVERKRIHAIPPPGAGRHAALANLYTPAATQETYARLEALARSIAGAGYPVLVDATFLARKHRQRLLRVAQELGIAAHILELRAPSAVLRSRVTERASRGRDVSDATVAVLETQLERDEPLRGTEVERAVTVDTSRPIDLANLARRLVGSPGSEAPPPPPESTALC